MALGTSELRSKLGRAKGLGSAHHGVSHWWLQRVTAVAMVPLALWFVYSILTVMLTKDVAVASEWFKNGINASLLLFLLAAMFFHAKLGFQVVIEDYVKNPVFKYGLLLANNFVAFGFGVVCMLAVLKLHFGN
jgi:succinate dehydrogenase / fumarate reductase membrane anchor subunit